MIDSLNASFRDFVVYIDQLVIYAEPFDKQVQINRTLL